MLQLTIFHHQLFTKLIAVASSVPNTGLTRMVLNFLIMVLALGF